MANQTVQLTSQKVEIDYQSLLNGPAGIPPAGIVSNFDNPPNLKVYLYLTLSLCFIFATLAFFTRIYTMLLRSVGYDDYFSMLSWIGFVGATVPAILAQKSGLGVHMWDIRLKIFFHLLYLENVQFVLYNIDVWLIKTSILLQYQRVFVVHKTIKSPMFVAIQFWIWIILLFYLNDTFFELFKCSPREKIWNKLLTGGHCNNSAAGFKGSGIFNIISDFALLSIPMAGLWNMQMPLKRKLLTMGIFAMGILACAASIIRAYYTWLVHAAADKSYNLAILTLCAAPELAIGIIVGCLPTMPKFLQHARTSITKAFNFTTKSKQARERKGTTSIIDARPKASGGLTSIRLFAAKYNAGSVIDESWSEPHSSHTKPQNIYLTPINSDTSSLQAPHSAPPPSLSRSTAAGQRQDDLEYGPHNNTS